MHKSIILLLGLLTFLIPVGPSSMSNSNVMAFEDYDYEADKNQVSSMKCNNINVNVNGLELEVLPPFLSGDSGLTSESQESDNDINSFVGNGADGSEINDFRFICINNNNNIVIVGEESPIPPEPPTGSLTVNKQVFGCDRISGTDMICLFPNNSTEYLDCNTNPAISGTEHCRSLPESLFDIEVLDDQNIPIAQFEGSEQGTTIQNLEPGTYTVNEIEHLSNLNQLGEEPTVEGFCTSAGFPDGGSVLNTTALIFYEICFEYEDEQGNDCSTITLAAGEERTCTVKNYIFSDLDIDPT